MARVLFIAAFLLVVGATQLKDSDLALRPGLIKTINSVQKKWTASADQGTLLSGATIGQVKGLLGARRQNKPTTNIVTHSSMDKAVPTSFDASANWPNCPTIMTIRDQSACGSCWAVAAAETISDRYCTILGDKDAKYQNVMISAANLLSCCVTCGMGCGGGYPDFAMQYWVNTGLALESCQPYPFPKCEHHISGGKYPPCPKNEYPTPPCSSTCTGNATATETLYTGSKSYSLSGEQDFQKEVMTSGPIEVTFDVYEDFLTYKSGVYSHTTGNFLGGHAVKLVGWGQTSDGTKYWVINNSWNTDWGNKGQFWIARGTDECGIEDSGSTGLPSTF
jgi:cysteine peptidase C